MWDGGIPLKRGNPPQKEACVWVLGHGGYLCGEPDVLREACMCTHVGLRVHMGWVYTCATQTHMCTYTGQSALGGGESWLCQSLALGRSLVLLQPREGCPWVLHLSPQPIPLVKRPQGTTCQPDPHAPSPAQRGPHAPQPCQGSPLPRVTAGWQRQGLEPTSGQGSLGLGLTSEQGSSGIGSRSG